MLSDIVGLVLTMAPVLGLLTWRERADRRQEAADIVRADIHAGMTRALDGESLVAVRVESPTRWRPGQVRLSSPGGYESLIGEASSAAIDRLPAGYYVTLECGGGS